MTDDLVDLVCMIYHEARNVRHTIKARRVPDEARFALLVNLPTNRDEAWRQMRMCREAARTGKGSSAIAATFERTYRVTVVELAELYERPIWKDSPTGGNAWASIAREVARALRLHETGQRSECEATMAAILQMPHNTGLVVEKLRRLRACEEG